ncbi:MAG: hypothetical protein AAFO69_13740 [Bacteroidota bacterium]
MKHYLNSLLLFFAVLATLSCSTESRFMQGEDLVFYNQVKRVQFEDIVYAAKMKGSFDSDTLMIQISTENIGEKSAVVTFPGAELTGQDGMRSKVVSASRMSINLRPGEKSVDTVYFVPINDMRVYQHSDLPGEFDEEYLFVPQAIKEVADGKGIQLTADPSGYTKYKALKKYGDLGVYNVVASEDLKAELLGNISTLYNDLLQSGKDTRESPKPGVTLTRKEILLGGYGLLIKAFELQGRLRIICRMTNHQGQTVNFDPARFSIVAEGKSHLPKKVSYLNKPSTWIQAEGQLSKGERVGVLLEFDGTGSESIIFSPQITFNENKVLIDKIPLNQVTLPSLE